jgi:MtN3 and saliva related transmembrane protein
MLVTNACAAKCRELSRSIREMDYVTVVGLAAAALTVISFSPQLVRVFRTKSTRDISLGTFSLFSAGVLLWFFYGIITNDTPIIIANALIFIQAFIILIAKVKYK